VIFDFRSNLPTASVKDNVYMEDKSISTSSFSEEENIEFRKEQKAPIRVKAPASEDSSMKLSDFIDENEPRWLSEKETTIEYSYEDLVSALDVAAYILKKLGCSMTTMKLQKLVYYCQAWSLVWDEKPLFGEDIEAWAYGPVVKNLFNYHRGQYLISSVLIGNPDLLDEQQKETIDAVLDYYGNKSSQWLSDLTHMEDPWKLTRMGTPELERGNKIISLELMANYYGSLPPNEEDTGK
jgi:uncharacterized phage-associated protein